ncbi:MAG: hypothetical protein KGI04_03915 [Candidatus Micrarchaeota archaeon]|nr:hypothetical protein [Candidatus Micrarchaeota archaeon]
MRLLRAQAAVDFMMSYGIALIIIFIAVAVIYKVSILSPALATSTCTGAPGFSCEAAALNSNGILTLQLSQATGGTVTINGAACSSLPSSVGNLPAYGNVHVSNVVTGNYVGANVIGTGISLYSGSSNTLVIYCYSSTGVATGSLGTSFTGFVWLNYTVPGYGGITQQVASLSLEYT